jgi:hypothetical protein
MGACVACVVGPVACQGDQSLLSCTDHGYEAAAACAGDHVNTCVGNACVSCPPGRANCNGNGADGCESTYEAPCEPCGPPRITCYKDRDGDGYGDPTLPAGSCGTCATGYVDNAQDCNDLSKDINPRGDWLLASIGGSWDSNCDGVIAHALVYSNGDVFPITTGTVNCGTAATETDCNAMPRAATDTTCGNTSVLLACGWPVDDHGCKQFQVNTDRTAHVACR